MTLNGKIFLSVRGSLRLQLTRLTAITGSKNILPLHSTKLLDREEFDIANAESLEEERARIEEELKNHNDFILVQQKLEKLPVKYQEVIALKYFEEKSTKEISEILGKKEGTIKSLISRGLQKLKDSFKMQPQEESTLKQ